MQADAHCKLCAEAGLLCRLAVEQLSSGKSNGPGHCLRISCLGKPSNPQVAAIFRAEARRPAATAGLVQPLGLQRYVGQAQEGA